MRKESVKVNIEIDRYTDLGALMDNLGVVKKLIGDLEEGLEMGDLVELMAHNGLKDLEQGRDRRGTL